MWTFLITLYALVLLTLITAASCVGISTTEHKRGDRATTILKLLLGAAFGTSGLTALFTRVHDAGLM